jgi:large subunit ribosomal protein L23
MKSFKNTEKVVRMIESDNVLAVEVNLKDKKTDIKKNLEKMLNVKIDKVNTLIKDNKKIAYVKLNKSNLSADVAAKYGLI